MTIDKIFTIEQFEDLGAEWDELLRASASDCVFLTHEWLVTWWKHLGEDRILSVLICREDDKIVGVAPLARRHPQYSRMMPELLEFLGSGVIGSDYLDFIVRSGHERNVLKRISDYLCESGRMLQLSQLRRGCSVASDLSQYLEQQGWLATDSRINVCPFIRTGAHTWESYLATLSPSQRYNFNRRLKNLNRNFVVRLECARSPEDAVQALDTLIALHKKRRDFDGCLSEAFHTESVVAFHREFVKLAAGRGWLRLLTLSLDGEPAAALYGIRYGSTFYFYQSGFDPAYNKQSVGLVMMGLAIMTAIDEGASEYDFLHGNEEYKFHWAEEVRELGRLELYPPRTLGMIYRHAIDLNRAARKMARRVLTRK